VSERDSEVRRAREEIEELEATRLELADAVMRGDHEARNEDRQLERRIRDLSRLIMRVEHDEEAERRDEAERRGEQLKEAWRKRHPMEDPDERWPRRRGGRS
jgi:hypothetical protein